MSKFLKQVWYGEKTFKILKDFEFRGGMMRANNYFTCTKEDYIIYKQFLSDEEFIKDSDHSEMTREELAEKRTVNKKKGKKGKKKEESKSQTKRKAVQKKTKK